MDRIIYYSDNFVISEGENGFVLNFIKDETDVEGVVDYGFRIGMSPLSTKEFFFALYNALAEYEQKYGEIKYDPALLRKIVREEKKPIGFRLMEDDQSSAETG